MRYRLIAQHIDQHAVVLGAGLAGLLIARVLAEHFSRVTVIAEAEPPDDLTQPQDVWQAIPAHLLSVQGQRNLERLFPGLQTELLAAGAPTIEWTADAPVRLPGGWGPRFHTDLVTRSASPNLLARIIRQRVLEYSRGCVTFISGDSVTQVESGRVRLKETWIEADLVVDTLGRESKMTQWLDSMGYDTPAQTTVSASMSIAARLFRQPQNFDPGWKALLVPPHETAYGGILVPVEEDGWLVMLVGHDGETPSESATGFADFAPMPLREALRQARPLTPVYTTHDTANRWWHIERLSRWPDHFLTTSAVNYNPAYGLELTMATVAALTLRETLDEQRKNVPSGDLDGLGMRFQKRLVRANDTPWRMVTAIDGAWASTPPDHLGRFAHWFGGHLVAAARADSKIYQTILETAGLVTPAYVLLNPAFARQVMRHSNQAGPVTDSAAPPAFQATQLHKIGNQQ